MHEHSDRPYEWVGGLSERRAQLSPDRPALTDESTGESYTYAELDRRANRTARLLAEHGVSEGGRVAVVSRNRPALVDLFFATGKTGGVLAPISHRLPPATIAALLETVDPRVVVAEEPFEADVADAVSQLDGEPVTYSLPTDGRCQWEALETATPTDSSAFEGPAVALSDPHLLLHTGGSTGSPKETVLTHGGIAWNATNTITGWGLRDDDVTPMLFPMFHTGGWNVLTVPLFQMGGHVLIDREVDPGSVLRTIDREAATVLVAVPAVLRSMVEHDGWPEAELSSLRFVKSGGGPARETVVDAWRERGVEISQGYGLTECGPNNFAMPDDWAPETVASVGKPAPHVDARIVGDDGERVQQGEIGELELAGPHAADGYLDATDETFGGEWISTGDLARIDDDGFYHIEGRKKSMFVSGGENVHPPRVEDAIADHPAVGEVVVIGVPDDRWGTVGKAVVEPASEATDGDEPLTLDELETFLADRLAGFEIPAELAFVERMPTSGPSKIDRAAIEAEFGGDER